MFGRVFLWGAPSQKVATLYMMPSSGLLKLDGKHRENKKTTSSSSFICKALSKNWHLCDAFPVHSVVTGLKIKKREGQSRQGGQLAFLVWYRLSSLLIPLQGGLAPSLSPPVTGVLGDHPNGDLGSIQSIKSYHLHPNPSSHLPCRPLLPGMEVFRPACTTWLLVGF